MVQAGSYVALDALRIGLVDDNGYFRRLVRTMLVGYGVKQIEEGGNANDAWDIVTRWQPDILLLDWNMGEPGGLAVLNRIRSDRDDGIATQAVMILSAHSDKRHVMSAARLGANDFLVKPFSARLLYERLKRVSSMRLVYARRGGRAIPVPTVPTVHRPMTAPPPAPVGNGNRDDKVLYL